MKLCVGLTSSLTVLKASDAIRDADAVTEKDNVAFLGLYLSAYDFGPAWQCLLVCLKVYVCLSLSACLSLSLSLLSLGVLGVKTNVSLFTRIYAKAFMSY